MGRHRPAECHVARGGATVPPQIAEAKTPLPAIATGDGSPA